MLSQKEMTKIIIDSLGNGSLEIIEHVCGRCQKVECREYRWNGKNLLVKAGEAKNEAIRDYGTDSLTMTRKEPE